MGVAIPEAKKTLDRLLETSRADLYKPIGVAEILYRCRNGGEIDLGDRELYGLRSHDWITDVVRQLHRRTAVLHPRRWDRMFEYEHSSPSMAESLNELNIVTEGGVEAYIYGNVADRFLGLRTIADELERLKPRDFRFADFLDRFGKDDRYRRSVDKAYEIVVYALFNAVTDHLGATVTLGVKPDRLDALVDFEDFAKMVLGIDRERPAVQVKHISLSAEQVDVICDAVQADQVLIVCKRADRAVVETVLRQTEFARKLRGVITDDDLDRWYAKACRPPYEKTIGNRLLTAIRMEMGLEFPLTNEDRIRDFLQRKYRLDRLPSGWEVKARR